MSVADDSMSVANNSIGGFCYKCGASQHPEYEFGTCWNCHGRHWYVPWEVVDRSRYHDDGSKRKTRLPEPEVPDDPPPEQSVVGNTDNSSTFPVPQVARDKQHKYFDWSCGQEITSRSQKKRIYKDLDMIEVSAKDEYRDKEKPRVRGRAVTYGGQKDHRSSAETDGVRTADGRRVI